MPTDRDVVLELTVERTKLFDAVRQFGTMSIAHRLLEVCLGGDVDSFKDELGLAMYGVAARRIREGERGMSNQKGDERE